MNERINERIKEWIKEWINKQMNKWSWFVGSLLENQEGTVHSLYMIKQMNEWMNEGMNDLG